MAGREMSGKDLLAQLYRDLNTVPAAVEAETDARTAVKRTPVRAADDLFVQTALRGEIAPEAPVARVKLARAPLMILCGVAVAGAIAAAALRDSSAPAAPPPVAAAPASSAAPVQVASEPAPEEIKYIEVVNPFDPTEVFKFPPGTSQADARDQMAELLLQRAIERKAHVPRTRKLAAEKRAASGGHGS
jgi:hypothetical protein